MVVGGRVEFRGLQGARSGNQHIATSSMNTPSAVLTLRLKRAPKRWCFRCASSVCGSRRRAHRPPSHQSSNRWDCVFLRRAALLRTNRGTHSFSTRPAHRSGTAVRGRNTNRVRPRAESNVRGGGSPIPAHGYQGGGEGTLIVGSGRQSLGATQMRPTIPQTTRISMTSALLFPRGDSRRSALAQWRT